eukprot:10533044-Alexandrium_andersonii.AAC.1
MPGNTRHDKVSGTGILAPPHEEAETGLHQSGNERRRRKMNTHLHVRGSGAALRSHASNGAKRSHQGVSQLGFG